MKKLLFVLTLAIFLFSSNANAAIPGIQETSQYQNLKNYVTFLQTQSTTPVTPTQKSTYQNNLNTKNVNAQSRVESLYQARRNKLINSYKKNQKKALKKINRTRNANLKNAASVYVEDIDYEKAVYRAAVASIDSRYAKKISKINKRIRKIKSQLSKTIDPTRTETLRLQLEDLRLEKQSLQEAKVTDLDIAKTNYKKTVADEKAAYKKRVKKINSRADRNINNQKRTRKAKLDSYIQGAKKRRTKEYSMVSSLKTSGQTAINSMPPAS
jgi:hypothetical protein